MLHSSLVPGDHDELLARLRTARAPVIAIIAPPGYGKSGLAASYAAEFTFSTVIYADSIDRAPIEAWVAAAGPACIVVEHAHRMDDSQLRSLLQELIERRPPLGSVVLTSAREPRFSLGELIEPHLTLVLRADELKITLERLRSIASTGGSVDDIALYRIYQFSAGWPAVAHFLLAAASRGQLDRDLSQLHRHAWAELFDWIDAYIRTGIDEFAQAALIEATTRMDSTLDDFGENGPDNPAVRLVRHYQLAAVGIEGEIRVTPFVRLYFYVRRKRELIEKAYELVDRCGDRDITRAVRALINVGEIRRAETMMAQMSAAQCVCVGDYPYPGTLLVKLSPIQAPYQLYPRVWLALNTARSFAQSQVTLAEEGVTLLEQTHLAPDLKRWIRLFTAAAFVRAGQLNVALDFIEELAAEEDAEAEAFADVGYALIDIINGKYLRAAERWNHSGSSLLATPTVYAFALRNLARASFASGAVTRAAEQLRLMMSLTAVGGSPFIYTAAKLESAILAWLLGNEPEFRQLRDEISSSLMYYDTPSYWKCIAAMHDLVLSGELVGDAYLDTMTDLILACQPRADAAIFAEAAIRNADESQNVWLRCISRIVAAAREPRETVERVAEARRIAQSIDAPALTTAIERFFKAQSEVTHLAPLVERARRGAAATPAPSASELSIDVVRGYVLRGAERLRLSDGTLALVMALAVHRTGVARERLIDLLWPDQDAIAALSALKMCVHRARAQLGDAEAIVVTRGAYALAPTISSNYQPLLDLATRSVTIPLPDDLRGAYQAFADLTWESQDAAWAKWPWFVHYQRAIGDAAQSIGLTLVRDAIARGELERALVGARSMCTLRPFDERPRMLVVQTLLAMRATAEAQKELRDYQEFLRRELGTEPSSEFIALLKGA